MSLFDAIKFQNEKTFAADLAQQLAKDVPSEMMEKRRKSLSVNKITRLLEKTYVKAKNYQQESAMGFLRRTVFVNAFQWELKNLNYPDDFVAMATEGLVVTLMKKTAE